LCCSLSHLTINLHHTEAPDFEVYFSNGTAYIKKGEDGACIYLRNGRCSIYERRPDVCRTFTCERFLEPENQQYDEATLNATVYPLVRAAMALQQRTRQSLARRFNDLLRDVK
jgi:Fe-S-cluster containining protein